MRVIVLPEIPGNANGYQLAVSSDLAVLGNNDNDCVICYSSQTLKGSNYLYLKRQNNDRLRYVSNAVQSRPASEVWVSDLRRLVPPNLNRLS